MTFFFIFVAPNYGRGGSANKGRGNNHDCKKETTPWSSCSLTCGMGVSVRVTNDNADCVPEQQRRLCLVRPCELNDRHLVITSYSNNYILFQFLFSKVLNRL